METTKTVMCDRCYHSSVCGIKVKYQDLTNVVDHAFAPDEEKFAYLRCNHFVPYQVNNPRRNNTPKDKEGN